MSGTGIGAMLIHRLAVLRYAEGARDEYGNPAQTQSVLASGVRGLVQPKNVREMAQPSQGGPVTSDHTIFLWPIDVHESDVIRFDPDDGRRYQVDGVRDAAGIGHHLELDAHMVEASA